MKKRIFWIVGIIILLSVIAIIVVDQCKVVKEYKVSLHRNYFEIEGYNS